MLVGIESTTHLGGFGGPLSAPDLLSAVVEPAWAARAMPRAEMRLKCERPPDMPLAWERGDIAAEEAIWSSVCGRGGTQSLVDAYMRGQMQQEQM